MRVSVWPNDAGYLAYKRGYKGCKVTLDGVEVNRALMADEELGQVVRAALNENGQVYSVDEEIATETLYGLVKITKP